jgi:signal transduction histidine kinase/ActR/RegA family two-component response regulator
MTRLFPLRTKLLLLVAGSLLPVLVLAWMLALTLLERERESSRAAAQARNRTFITALEQLLESQLSSMRALASSAALERGDLKTFDGEARRTQATQVGWQNVMLVAQDGTHLINMRVAYGGGPMPTAAGAELQGIQRAVRSGTPVIGNLARGPITNNLGIALRLRVQPRGHEPMVLQVILRPDSVAELMRAQQYPARWAFGLVDGKGEFIARIPERPPGSRISRDFEAAIRRGPEGWFRGRTVEGWDTYTAYQTSPMTGWTVGVGIPADELLAGAWRMAGYITAGAICSLLLALGFAWWLGGRIARPIAQLAAAARQIGRAPVGQLVHDAQAHSRVAEVQEVAAALEEAEAGLAEREALREREQQALRSADKAKDEFLAMLGHELRNPLSAITASAHVLRLSRPDATATLRAHEVIDRQARQMTRLVEDLMDVSRLAMGKVTLHHERVDLAALAERVVHTWQQSGRSRSGRVRLRAQPTWIDGDRARIEQVLSNLLDNAHKFSADGAPIEVTIGARDGDAVLEVRDHGDGISADELPRIFELFVQGAQPLDRPQGGLGLGLALVKRLVELQGGQVSAHSGGPGQGATFTVRLPLAQALPDAPAERAAAATAAGRRVLLVEDNEDGRHMMEMVLALEGHTVRSVSSGLEAVNVAAAWAPDIALVDIGLPDIDGYEVARRIRALRPDTPPKLVAVSGFGQPQDQRTAYEAGFDLHLTKPVAPDFLRDVMQALTSRQTSTP